MVNSDSLKTDALKTAMRNPKLSKIILEAAKSPMGSTKRFHADNVLGSLHNAHINHAQKMGLIQPPPIIMMAPAGKGQGGKSDMMMSPPPPAPTYLSLKPILNHYDFTAVPVAKPPMNLTPPQYTGQGGGQPQNTTYQAPRALQWLKTGIQGVKNFLGQATSGLANVSAQQQSGLGALGTTVGKVAATVPLGISAAAEQVGNVGKYAFGNPNDPYTTIGQTAGSQLISKMFPSAASAQTQPSVPSQNFPNITSNPALSPENVVYKPEVSSPPSPTADTNTGNLAYGPAIPEGFTRTTDNTGDQATGNPLVDYLLKSYKEGIGRNAFALGVMSDSSKLQSLFPGVPVDQIPVGASLAGQLTDLQNSLKKEYHLDQLRDNLLQQVKVGQTAPDDLTAYIRGKDDYLNTVDKMLQKSNDQFLSASNRSDPFYAKSMGQYINYLTILKGRQTQRYVDFLNTGINSQNATIKNLQDTYNSLADQANQLFQQKSAITTEQYNQTKDTLMEMYDNTAKRADLLNSNSQLYKDQQASNLKSLSDVINVVKNISGSQARQNLLDQYGFNTVNEATLPQPTGSKTANNISAADKKQLTDELGNAHNFQDALSNAVLQQYSPELVLDQYAELAPHEIGSDFGKFAGSYADDKKAYDHLNKLSTQYQQAKDAALAEGKTSLAENYAALAEERTNLAQNYAQKVDANYTKQITEFVTNNLEGIKNALKDMANYSGSWDQYIADSGGWFGKAKSNKLKNDWKVPEAVAQYLFNIAQANKAENFDKLTPDIIAAAIVNSVS